MYDDESLAVGFETGAIWADSNPVNPWKSVKEELPKEDGLYLTLSIVDFGKRIGKKEIYDVGSFESGKWMQEKIEVRYWMPIPQINQKEK